MIYDMAIRRELIGLGQEIAGKAMKADVETEPADQIVEAEQKLYNLSDQGRTERGFQSFLSAVTDAVKIANAAYSATAVWPASPPGWWTWTASWAGCTSRTS